MRSPLPSPPSAPARVTDRPACEGVCVDSAAAARRWRGGRCRRRDWLSDGGLSERAPSGRQSAGGRRAGRVVTTGPRGAGVTSGSPVQGAGRYSVVLQVRLVIQWCWTVCQLLCGDSVFCAFEHSSRNCICALCDEWRTCDRRSASITWRRGRNSVQHLLISNLTLETVHGRWRLAASRSLVMTDSRK